MRRAEMITVVVHERATDEPLEIEPDLVAHVLARAPTVSSGSVPGKRTLVFAMSKEDWEQKFPAD